MWLELGDAFVSTSYISGRSCGEKSVRKPKLFFSHASTEDMADLACSLLALRATMLHEFNIPAGLAKPLPFLPSTSLTYIHDMHTFTC